MIIDIKKAANLLLHEQVIAYPTEAVYGLGCLPQNESAVHKILALKQRSIEKGLILIASKFNQLTPWIAEDTLEKYPYIKESWQDSSQANTWLVPYLPNTPTWLTGQYSTLAVRVTHNPTVQTLCNYIGSALVSTSANPTGKKAATSAMAVNTYFHSLPVLNGELSGLTSPSTIRDASTQELIRV